MQKDQIAQLKELDDDGLTQRMHSESPGSRVWLFCQQELQRKQLAAIKRPKWIEWAILFVAVLSVLFSAFGMWENYFR